MQRISDALELLTAQHDEIDAQLAEIAAAPHAARTAAITVLADRLTVHLALEQELFYPVISLTPDVHRELVAEHLEIKRVLADLLWGDPTDDELVTRSLSTLHQLLAVHTAYQEQHLFENVAETRSPEQLAQLGHEMRTWVDSLVSQDDQYSHDSIAA